MLIISSLKVLQITIQVHKLQLYKAHDLPNTHQLMNSQYQLLSLQHPQFMILKIEHLHLVRTLFIWKLQGPYLLEKKKIKNLTSRSILLLLRSPRPPRQSRFRVQRGWEVLKVLWIIHSCPCGMVQCSITAKSTLKWDFCLQGQQSTILFLFFLCFSPSWSNCI